MIETLPPFQEFPTCPACGHTRNRIEKLSIRFCPGCSRFGDTEHLHVACNICTRESAMNTAGGVEPLTAREIRDFRDLIPPQEPKGALDPSPF